MKNLRLFTTMLLLLGGVACGGNSSDSESNESNKNGTAATKQSAEVKKEPQTLYGIECDGYEILEDTIVSNETVGKILNRYGISAVKIDRLDKAAKEIFPLSKIKAGNKYSIFAHNITTDEGEVKPVADYMVYHIDKVDVAVFDLTSDQPTVNKISKERETIRKRAEATITSSLWESIVGQGLSYELAAEFEDIYQWTVDFFHIQNGDSFTVIYDDVVADGESIGIGRIWGARFVHHGKEYYAIPFVTDGNKVSYWEFNGESLKKQMLKAPLKYTRISSKFTYKRLHPVHKVYKPHTGVDYAAPAGTPVHAVADGTIIKAGWGGGGGNTIKIQHTGGLQTGYLHLQKFASGIKEGVYVTQGQTIGYVGSTGTSTGPHLDYRIWKNGTPIDPLSITQQPSEPIGDKYRQEFEAVRDRVVAELKGEEIPGGAITEADIFRTK